jgi:hypothetical protein
MIARQYNRRKIELVPTAKARDITMYATGCKLLIAILTHVGLTDTSVENKESNRGS